MAAPATLAELAAALRLDSADDPRLAILAPAADEWLRARLAGAHVPDAVLKEAYVRFVAYGFDAPEAPAGTQWANHWVNSGAATALGPFLVHVVADLGGAADAEEGGTPGGSGLDEVARAAAAVARDIAERAEAAAGAANVRAGANSALLERPSDAEADAGVAGDVRGWSAALIRRVVEAVVPRWARQATPNAVDPVARREAAANSALLQRPSDAEAAEGVSGDVRGWSAALIRRVVEAVLAAWVPLATIRIDPPSIAAVADLDGTYHLDIFPRGILPSVVNYLEIWVGGETVHTAPYDGSVNRIEFVIDTSEETSIGLGDNASVALIRAVFRHRFSGVSLYVGEARTLLEISPTSGISPTANGVPNTPGTATGVNSLLAVTGENDRDYAWRRAADVLPLAVGGGLAFDGRGNLHTAPSLVAAAAKADANALKAAANAAAIAHLSTLADPVFDPAYWIKTADARSFVVALDPGAIQAGDAKVRLHIQGVAVATVAVVAGQHVYELAVAAANAGTITRAAGNAGRATLTTRVEILGAGDAVTRSWRGLLRVLAEAPAGGGAVVIYRTVYWAADDVRLQHADLQDFLDTDLITFFVGLVKFETTVLSQPHTPTYGPVRWSDFKNTQNMGMIAERTNDVSPRLYLADTRRVAASPSGRELTFMRGLPSGEQSQAGPRAVAVKIERGVA